VLLEKGLGQDQSNIERRKQLLSKFEKRIIPEEVKKIDAVALVREDRER